MQEAVWFKDGIEVAWIDPIISIENENLGPKCVRVSNGFNEFQSGDGVVPSDVDAFIVRERYTEKDAAKTQTTRIESVLNRSGISLYSDSDKTKFKSVSDVLDEVASVFHNEEP